MPVLHMGWNDDDISRMDDLDRTAFHLDAARAGRDDEYLTEGMRMPCASRAWRKGHNAPGDPRWSIHRK